MKLKTHRQDFQSLLQIGIPLFIQIIRTQCALSAKLNIMMVKQSLQHIASISFMLNASILTGVREFKDVLIAEELFHFLGTNGQSEEFQ